jgi:hypothetical protein
MPADAYAAVIGHYEWLFPAIEGRCQHATVLGNLSREHGVDLATVERWTAEWRRTTGKTIPTKPWRMAHRATTT